MAEAHRIRATQQGVICHGGKLVAPIYYSRAGKGTPGFHMHDCVMSSRWTVDRASALPAPPRGPGCCRRRCRLRTIDRELSWAPPGLPRFRCHHCGNNVGMCRPAFRSTDDWIELDIVIMVKEALGCVLKGCGISLIVGKLIWVPQT